ncbi:hypothetical protein [Mycoplasmopsis iners]|uniref:hypothetical protein n=1 Tax=Mycoplasmopsis iners TaxID=76630 RepID=UPI0004957EC2|nr:hypothetical protein [Mycoplasmopsis iners]
MKANIIKLKKKLNQKLILQFVIGIFLLVATLIFFVPGNQFKASPNSISVAILIAIFLAPLFATAVILMFNKFLNKFLLKANLLSKTALLICSIILLLIISYFFTEICYYSFHSVADSESWEAIPLDLRSTHTKFMGHNVWFTKSTNYLFNNGNTPNVKYFTFLFLIEFILIAFTAYLIISSIISLIKKNSVRNRQIILPTLFIVLNSIIFILFITFVLIRKFNYETWNAALRTEEEFILLVDLYSVNNGVKNPYLTNLVLSYIIISLFVLEAILITGLYIKNKFFTKGKYANASIIDLILAFWAIVLVIILTVQDKQHPYSFLNITLIYIQKLNYEWYTNPLIFTSFYCLIIATSVLVLGTIWMHLVYKTIMFGKLLKHAKRATV